MAGSIESGILSLTLRSGSELKMKAFSANEHSVVYGNHFVLGASHDSFPIVLVLWLQGQQLWDFCVALIQRDNGISGIYVPNQFFSINSNQELTKRGRKTARYSGECNHEMGITTRTLYADKAYIDEDWKLTLNRDYSVRIITPRKHKKNDFLRGGDAFSLFVSALRQQIECFSTGSMPTPISNLLLKSVLLLACLSL